MPSLRTILLVVGVPVVLLVGISIGIGQLETQFRDAIVAEFGAIPPERVNDFRLSTLCGLPEFRTGFSPCDDFRVGQVLQAAGQIAVVISALSLALTLVASRYAGHNRDRLASIFRPALTLLQVVVVILILFEGAMAVGAGYLLETGLFGAYHPAVLFGIGLAAVIAAWGVLRATLSMRRRMTMDVKGLAVDSTSQPGLAQFAADVAQAVGTEPPAVIAVGLEPTFYVIDGDATTLSGPRSGRLLYVSLPLSRILSIEELRAVLGHEMGHFKGDDTRYSQRFAPVYRSAIDAFGAVSGAATGLSRFVLLPTLEILGLFLTRFSTAERFVQRKRELAADSVGAGIASPTAVATSLIKLQAFVPLWGDVLNRTSRSIGLGQTPANPSLAFAERVRQGVVATKVDQLEEAVVPHPTDSHPRLRERLANVGVGFDSVAEEALSGQVAGPAIDLIHDVAGVEQALTDELAGHVKDVLGFAGPGFDVEAPLRKVAETEPAVARALELVERAHGGTLLRPVDYNVRWRVLVPVAVADHPKPQAFLATVNVMTLPAGEQQLVVGFSTADTPMERVLGAGMELKPIGINSPAERRQGYAEDFYEDAARIVVVQSVGSGEIAAQLAGLFVVPSGDPLARQSRDMAHEIAALIPDLIAWQARLAATEPSAAD
jgi:Zn-dependent protease with chaperone function